MSGQGGLSDQEVEEFRKAVARIRNQYDPEDNYENMDDQKDKDDELNDRYRDFENQA